MTWTPTLFDEPTTRATVSVDVGPRSAWLTGYGLNGYLDELDCPRMWCPVRKRLTIPVDRVGDLLALLEHRDHRVVELRSVAEA
ncbi:hypothetical protein [Blastococcus sp. TF02A-35]|uniref:hypothetical protein n=1 Tax=Blastococcus sp. TF02A-35 TaxID=2559612 RepID=UPI00142F4223|nr:hypothetical protein [Blastococcus sp. TF02A_35]